MRRRIVEILSLVSFALGIFGILHQGVLAGDWFDWTQFRCHESLIAMCFVCSVSLLVGKYIGKWGNVANGKKQKGS